MGSARRGSNPLGVELKCSDCVSAAKPLALLSFCGQPCACCSVALESWNNMTPVGFEPTQLALLGSKLFECQAQDCFSLQVSKNQKAFLDQPAVAQWKTGIRQGSLQAMQTRHRQQREGLKERNKIQKNKPGRKERQGRQQENWVVWLSGPQACFCFGKCKRHGLGFSAVQ